MHYSFSLVGLQGRRGLLTNTPYRPPLGLDFELGLLLFVRFFFLFSGFWVGEAVARTVGSAPRIRVRPSANCSVTIGLAAGLNL